MTIIFFHYHITVDRADCGSLDHSCTVRHRSPSKFKVTRRTVVNDNLAPNKLLLWFTLPHCTSSRYIGWEGDDTNCQCNSVAPNRFRISLIRFRPTLLPMYHIFLYGNHSTATATAPSFDTQTSASLFRRGGDDDKGGDVHRGVLNE